MKRLLVILGAVAASVAMQADLLDDIIAGRYRARQAEQMTPMPDGRNFARLVGGKRVIAYSYLTGQPVDTLFDAASTKLTKVDSVEGFLLSPDGQRMLLYKDKHRVYRRTFTADYYLLDISRRELRRLSEGGRQMSPTFSPDGRYIAFARANNIYVYKADFGTEVAVTTDGQEGRIINGTPDWLYEEEFSTNRLMSWSPDSKQLAFVRLDESEVKAFGFQHYLRPADGSDSPDGLMLYPWMESFKYPKAGERNAEATVCVYDAYYKSIKTMQLPEKDDCYIPRLRWTADPSQLAVFRLNRNQNDLEMYYANPRSTVCRLMYRERQDTYVDFQQIDEWQFLQDGGFVAVNETDGWRNIYLYDHNGTRLRQLTKDLGDVTRCYGLNEQTRTLYFQAAAPNPMSRSVYSLNLKNNRLTLLTPEAGWHVASFTPDKSYFTDNYSAIGQPNRVVVRDHTGKVVRTLVDNEEVRNRFAALGLPEKQFTTLDVSGGLNGWVLLPAGFDSTRTYPLLMVQYSGPNSQQATNQWSIGWEYYLAQQGYAVACFDGRGTGARGTDFRKCTYRRLGRLETEDQVGVARALGSLPYIDADRIAIWGWSYGGFEVLNAMSTGQPVFRCGIAVAPVTDWRFYDSAYSERYMSRPQENDRGFAENAPLANADKLNGRLLIVHGTADDNVHFQNTMHYVHRLVNAGKQFDMMVYPDDNHFLRQGNNYRHLYRRFMDFLGKNL